MLRFANFPPFISELLYDRREPKHAAKKSTQHPTSRFRGENIVRAGVGRLLKPDILLESNRGSVGTSRIDTIRKRRPLLDILCSDRLLNCLQCYRLLHCLKCRYWLLNRLDGGDRSWDLDLMNSLFSGWDLDGLLETKYIN